MKILIFGRSGQVGQELLRRCPPEWDIDALDRQAVDLTDREGLARAIRSHRADVVINAAAWTNVDLAETHEKEAEAINADAPHVMAQECANLQIPFLHISTDYVFNGVGDRAFASSDPTAPLNAYGRTKLRGEDYIKTTQANFLILRTSWVFSSHGHNFLKSMVRLGRERKSLNIVADQIGGPTPASAIADTLLKAASRMHAGQKGGIYHFSGTPDSSWADFARAIMAEAKLNCDIHDIESADYPTPAKRPNNSRLDCTSLLHDFDVMRPDWRASIQPLLRDLGVIA